MYHTFVLILSRYLHYRCFVSQVFRTWRPCSGIFSPGCLRENKTVRSVNCREACQCVMIIVDAWLLASMLERVFTIYYRETCGYLMTHQNLRNRIVGQT